MLYEPSGRREVPIPDYDARYTTAELDLMWDAWSQERPLASHDAVWAKGTLEMCLAIRESSKTGQEVVLRHQTPC